MDYCIDNVKMSQLTSFSRIRVIGLKILRVTFSVIPLIEIFDAPVPSIIFDSIFEWLAIVTVTTDTYQY